MNSSYLKHKFYNQIYLKILDTNKNLIMLNRCRTELAFKALLRRK